MRTKIPSIESNNPTFSTDNIFKPTPKRDVIVGMMIKMVSLGLIGLGGTLLAMVAIAGDMSKTLIYTGVLMNIAGFLSGAIGEGIILLKKEEPASSLFRAAEDIKSNPTTVTIESTPQATNIETTDDTNTPNN